MPVKSENTKGKRKEIRGISLLKPALFLFILVLIIGVAIYAFLDINPTEIFTNGVNGLYKNIISKSKSELTEKVKHILTYDVNEPIYITTASSNLVVADTSSVRVYDMDGNEKTYLPVSLNKPYIQSHKKNTLIADLEGRYLGLLHEGKLMWQKSLDEDIAFASISDNWILLITDSREMGYKRCIRALSTDGQELSIRNISNYYPITAYHYPGFENSTFVINGMDISGLESNGFFDFLDLSMNQKASIRGDNEILAKGVLAGENLLLYGEKSLILIDNQFNSVWEKKYNEPSVLAANVISEKYPVFAQLDTEIFLRENRQVSNIQILNQDSSQRHSFVIDDLVSNITCQGGTAALTAGFQVFFINSKGEVMDTYTSTALIEGVYLAREDLAYIYSPGQVSRVNIAVNKKLLGIF